MADVLTGYTWSKSANRYRNQSSGQFVSRRSIVSLLNEQVNGAEKRLEELATALHEKRIAPSVWAEQMRTEMRRLEIQQIALAKGGFSQLNQRDYGRAGASLRQLYAQIVGTAEDVRDEKVTLPQLLNRIGAYVGEGRRLYHVTERENRPPAAEGNTSIARRLLAPDAAHCADCPTYYDRGYVLASEVVAPGENCQCQSHCRCSVNYRDVPTSELGEWLNTKR